MNVKRSYAVLAFATLVVCASSAAAESPLNATKSLRDNLQTFVGNKQAVTVVLKNGKEYRGRVGAIGDQSVVLTEIAGKEFFDVIVPIKQIMAIEARAREN
jgi:small nuclear ribonucleoprotein (snRNP)-like protein